eukprot:5463145-Pyramimonas_sp.AAC.1
MPDCRHPAASRRPGPPWDGHNARRRVAAVATPSRHTRVESQTPFLRRKSQTLCRGPRSLGLGLGTVPGAKDTIKN